ncbi:RHOMBOID-like protein 8 [Cornus florida]|uniref:RHOMBOID-like protein 8 n=1 Tax=Cornus florida TaxID=4283 RepID=UPI002897C0DA|nr:RHOMBOID-like protein 8 [Cornus florida]
MAPVTPKDQTQIEIKPQQPRFSVDCADDSLKGQRVPFFGPLSQKRENTWVISLFVMLHLLAFAATMIVNDCWQNSHGECALSPLGRLSFQPLSENPLLGPSASALDEMGALRKTLLTKHHQTWRVFTYPWLHAGVVHLLINLSSIIFIGVHLEQEFGPSRIGIIYILSAAFGGVVAALFVQDRPSVSSSGALFGLLGAMVSGLIQYWNFYSKKFSALLAFFFIFTINLALGLMPYINNFSNIGGFISGFLLGFVLLFSPQLGQMGKNKGGLFDYDVEDSPKVKLRQKLDKPLMRSVSLVLFSLIFAGGIIAVVHGINVSKYCRWCQYIDCVPSKCWSCNDKPIHCETMATVGRLTLTCTGTDKFRIFPYTDISQTRIKDLCTLICS